MILNSQWASWRPLSRPCTQGFCSHNSSMCPGTLSFNKQGDSLFLLCPPSMCCHRTVPDKSQPSRPWCTGSDTPRCTQRHCLREDKELVSGDSSERNGFRQNHKTPLVFCWSSVLPCQETISQAWHLRRLPSPRPIAPVPLKSSNHTFSSPLLSWEKKTYLLARN